MASPSTISLKAANGGGAGHSYGAVGDGSPLLGQADKGGIPYSQAMIIEDGNSPSRVAINATHDEHHGRETFPPPRLTPFFTFQQALSAGEHKAETHWAATIVLGLLAGMYIAIGALLAINIGGGVPGFMDPEGLYLPGIQKLLFSMVFPVGLLLVSLSGAELVTSSLALVTVSLLEGTVSLKGLAKNWGISYVCNFLGSLFFVGLALQADIFYNKNDQVPSDESWTAFAVEVACKKANLSFKQAFTRGFMCNWLVCLAVWNAGGANTVPGKALAIWPAIMAFVAMVRWMAEMRRGRVRGRAGTLTAARRRTRPHAFGRSRARPGRASSTASPTCFSSRSASSWTSATTRWSFARTACRGASSSSTTSCRSPLATSWAPCSWSPSCTRWPTAAVAPSSPRCGTSSCTR